MCMCVTEGAQTGTGIPAPSQPWLTGIGCKYYTEKEIVVYKSFDAAMPIYDYAYVSINSSRGRGGVRL